MPFTVEDFHDFMRLAEAHPDWRAGLRRLVLTDDLLAMPGQLAELASRVTDLAEAQQRTEARLTDLAEAQQRTEARVTDLAEAQQRTEARLTDLAEAQQRTEARLTDLAEAQQRTEARLTDLAEAQQRTEARLTGLIEQVAELAEAQKRMENRLEMLAEGLRRLEMEVANLTTQVARILPVLDDVGTLKGKNLEMQYLVKGQTYFSRIVRRPHVLTPDEMVTLIEDASDRGMLSEHEVQALYNVNVIARGNRRHDKAEVYLVAEVSWVVDAHDVTRAAQRAAILARLGLQTLPVVGGERILPEAAALAQNMAVWQLVDGRVISPA